MPQTYFLRVAAQTNLERQRPSGFISSTLSTSGKQIGLIRVPLKGADLKGCADQGSGRMTHKENEDVVLQLSRLGPPDYDLYPQL